VARAKLAATSSVVSSLPKKRFKRSLDTANICDTITEDRIDSKGTLPRKHRIVTPPAFHACGDGRQVVVTEHMLSVPLSRQRTVSVPHAWPVSSIDIYFAVVEKIDSFNKAFFTELAHFTPERRAKEYVEDACLQTADDMMLFLQGGPGFGAPTPVAGISLNGSSSWVASALNQYSRIVLMDQRGTGRSNPITKQSLERLFQDLFQLDNRLDVSSQTPLEELKVSHSESAEKVQFAVAGATTFLAQFRADNIVEDAEAVKNSLLDSRGTSKQPGPWGCALGQSFGGFCLMTYLSKISHPPKICLLTGGIAPMLTPMNDVYTNLWGRVKERNRRYYDAYPGDIPIVKLIVKTLLEDPVPLPSGGKLTARRFLQLGISLGGGSSSFAKLHSMLASAFLDNSDLDDELEFKRSFLKEMDSSLSYDDNPLYFWLHETIYADGPETAPTNWAAHRAYEDLCKANKEFDYKYTSSLNDNAKPTLFFGEMVFPWMADDFQELSGIGLKAVANALATKKDWGKLYDPNRMRTTLSDGSSVAAAAVYYEGQYMDVVDVADVCNAVVNLILTIGKPIFFKTFFCIADMYVDFNACMKVASQDSPLEHCKIWVTNEYQHSGIRDDEATIFSKLHNMATGSIRVPS